MLTCDAYAACCRPSRVDPAQAMYHFLSGFTSKTPGTEIGVTEPQPSRPLTCFGAPFMPRRPEVYGKLPDRRSPRPAPPAGWSIPSWTGGALAPAKRMPICAARALPTAALDGSLNSASSARIRISASRCRSRCRASTQLLDPRQTWADPAAYDAQARKLVSMFSDNFAQYADKIDDDVRPPPSAEGG